MLGSSPVSAVVPTTDIAKAKDFYQNKLGLKLSAEGENMPLMFEAGAGTMIVVYQRETGNKADHTQAGFKVEGIEGVVSELEAKGVAFEDYDIPGAKMVNHVSTWGNAKSAWFKDPDGNIIALNEYTQA